MKWVASLLAALGAAIGLAGCSSGSSDSSSPLAVSSSTVAENFTGTIAVNGTDFHTFTVGGSGGTVSVTLTAAGPPATIYMGVGIGTPAAATATAAASCALLTNGSVATPPGTAPQLSGTVGPGNYCVTVFDVGNETAQVTYAVTVQHP